MAKLTSPHTSNGPVVAINLATDRGSIGTLAIIDSGASRSLFPKPLAAQLGLSEQDLEEDETEGIGVEGGSFRTWSAKLPIAGQILYLDPKTSGFRNWGPSFTMDPAFADTGHALLGRSDFFQPFSITFWAESGQSLYTIEHATPEPKESPASAEDALRAMQKLDSSSGQGRQPAGADGSDAEL